MSEHLETIERLFTEETKQGRQRLPMSQQAALLEFQAAHKEKYGGRKIAIEKLVILFLDYAIEVMNEEKEEVLEVISDGGQPFVAYVFGDVWEKEDEEEVDLDEPLRHPDNPDGNTYA